MEYKFRDFLLKDENLSYILNILLSWLFGLAILGGIVSLTILGATNAEMAWLVFRAVVIFGLILYNRYTMAAFGVIAGLVGILAYRSLTGDNPAAIFLTRAHMIYDTWFFMTGEFAYTAARGAATLELLALGIGLISAVLLRVRFSYPFIFALGAGVFLSVNLGHPYGMGSMFGLMLVALILIYIKRAGNGVRKVAALVPVCALAVVLAVAMPMPNIDEGRRVLSDLYEEIFWLVREPFMPRHFSTHWLGFEQRDGTLGGNLRQNGDFIMWVFADEPVYLREVTMDTFTGRSWESRWDDDEFSVRAYPDFSAMRNMVLMDYMAGNRQNMTWDWNTMTMTPPRDAATISYVFHDEIMYRTELRQVSVNVGRVRTGTIFTPPGAVALNIRSHDYDVLQRGPDLRSAPTFGRNTAYSFLYHTVNIEDPFITEILQRSHRGFYEMRVSEIDERIEFLEDYFAVGLPFYSGRITRYIYTNFRIPYAEYVFENYLALPDTLPERVWELAHDISAGYESDFERAMAIRAYLLRMPYSLTPGDLPEGRDFVDHFLFDVRRGYCTHFASAMSVMARMIGVPSRYNMGFVTTSYMGNGTFRVYGLDAHAWAELYFEGVGWVIFEATPEYESGLDLAALTFPELDWDALRELEDYYYEMYLLQQMMDEQWGMGMWTFTPGEATEVVHEDVRSINVTAIVAGVIVVALGGYMIFRKLEENRRHLVINGDDYSRAVQESFRGLIELLALYGLPIRMNETAIAYARRIEKMSPLGTWQARTASEVFSRARYSLAEIEASDAEFLRRSYFVMYAKLKDTDYKGRWVKFFVHRYLWRLYR